MKPTTQEPASIQRIIGWHPSYPTKIANRSYSVQSKMGVTIHPPSIHEDHEMCKFQWRFYLDRGIFKLRNVHLQACYSKQVFKLV